MLVKGILVSIQTDLNYNSIAIFLRFVKDLQINKQGFSNFRALKSGFRSHHLAI